MAIRSSTKLCSCDVVRSFLCCGGHQAAARDATSFLVTKTTSPLHPKTCDVLKCQVILNQSLAAESCLIYKSLQSRSSTGLQPSVRLSQQTKDCYINQLEVNKVPGIVQFVQSEEKLETALRKPSAVQLSMVLLRLREQVSFIPKSQTSRNLY